MRKKVRAKIFKKYSNDKVNFFYDWILKTCINEETHLNYSSNEPLGCAQLFIL